MRSNGRRSRERTKCSVTSAVSSTALSSSTKPGQELFVGDAWWLPPDGEPLGPMALDVRCEMAGPACRLIVTQSGLDEGPRWDRYYDVIEAGWKASLGRLKALLEAD